MRARRTRRTDRGFTLVELMLVVMIIGIISALSLPLLQKSAARAMRAEMFVVLDKLRVYLKNQYENQGHYNTCDASTPWQPHPPPDDGGTIALGQPASWNSIPAAAAHPCWRDLPFPPDGPVKMRYRYTSSGDNLTLFVRGSFPGVGEYFYSESWVKTNPASPVHVVEAPEL